MTHVLPGTLVCVPPEVLDELKSVFPASGRGHECEFVKVGIKVPPKRARKRPPRSWLCLYWAEIEMINENAIIPALMRGKVVFVESYGYHACKYAAIHARGNKEKLKLLLVFLQNLVKARIVGEGIVPPYYFLPEHARNDEVTKLHFAPCAGQHDPVYLSGSVKDQARIVVSTITSHVRGAA